MVHRLNLFRLFHRRLSQRPTAEELEQRNILKREYESRSTTPSIAETKK